MDRSRSYEIKIIGIDELKKKLTLETVDYREPYSHTCHCDMPHHQAHAEHAHDQAQVRIITIKVKSLSNAIVEDKEGEEVERCCVTWTTRISNDSNNVREQLKGITAYKKAEVKAIQETMSKNMLQEQEPKVEDMPQ